MADDPKLWLAVITGGLALAGTAYTAFMNMRGRREQDTFKAKTDQELTRLNHELMGERDTRLARAEAEKALARFRDPLMHAAYDLQSRIYNILRKDFLDRYYNNGTPAEKKYAVDNTVFLVAQFLGWTELLRQDVQFLDLGSDEHTRKLRRLQDRIYSQLQTDAIPDGFRLFAGEQRAIGELMIDRAGTTPRCLGFAAFSRSRPPGLDYWLQPLRDDIPRMAANPATFEQRLIPIQRSLIRMLKFFDPTFVRFPRASRRKLPRR